jgi:lysine-ketoglutarate reductase/saccharopine dehydrogenase-like protein (TIGR00300 family)
MPAETVCLDGHIVDSLTLSKVLDLILRDGGQYRITDFKVGATRSDISHAEIQVSADSAAVLEQILRKIQQHGATRATGDAETRPAPADGVFPEGFYVTTNLETAARVQGRWLPVDPIEMDCGIVLEHAGDAATANCRPMHHIREGDSVVVGSAGVRVSTPDHDNAADIFRFMGSDVSTERPKELVIEAIAQAMVDARAKGGRILFVGGPAILHTGAGHFLASIIAAGWVDVLFAGNALATHDIERALLGTSLGVAMETGLPMVHGHENHLRAINTVRRVGGIRQAVEQSILTSGIMHACVVHDVPYVLAGSIRDDGPLPDVITDSIAAQDAMRAQVRGVGVALMVATTLHSVATGNLLPAAVRTVCVDADADTVVKLMDRGTHQAFGLVTDCEYFLKELAARLPGVRP